MFYYHVFRTGERNWFSSVPSPAPAPLPQHSPCLASPSNHDPLGRDEHAPAGNPLPATGLRGTVPGPGIPRVLLPPAAARRGAAGRACAREPLRGCWPARPSRVPGAAHCPAQALSPRRRTTRTSTRPESKSSTPPPHSSSAIRRRGAKVRAFASIVQDGKARCEGASFFDEVFFATN